MRKRVGTEPVEPANPYWRSRAVTLADRTDLASSSFPDQARRSLNGSEISVSDQNRPGGGAVRTDDPQREAGKGVLPRLDAS
jgi:hypothetical protein